MSFTAKIVPGIKAQGLGGLGYVSVNPAMDVLRRVVKLDPLMTAAATAAIGTFFAGVMPQEWRQPVLGGWGAESSRMVAKTLGISFLQPANFGQLAEQGDKAKIHLANSGQVAELERNLNSVLSETFGRPINLSGDQLVNFLGKWSTEMRAQKKAA